MVLTGFQIGAGNQMRIRLLDRRNFIANPLCDLVDGNSTTDEQASKCPAHGVSRAFNLLSLHIGIKRGSKIVAVFSLAVLHRWSDYEGGRELVFLEELLKNIAHGDCAVVRIFRRKSLGLAHVYQPCLRIKPLGTGLDNLHLAHTAMEAKKENQAKFVIEGILDELITFSPTQKVTTRGFGKLLHFQFKGINGEMIILRNPRPNGSKGADIALRPCLAHRFPQMLVKFSTLSLGNMRGGNISEELLQGVYRVTGGSGSLFADAARLHSVIQAFFAKIRNRIAALNIESSRVFRRQSNGFGRVTCLKRNANSFTADRSAEPIDLTAKNDSFNFHGTACARHCVPFLKLDQPRTTLFPLKKRAGNRVRTDDLLITNQLLYQLSYAGLPVLYREGMKNKAHLFTSGKPRGEKVPI